MYSQNNEDEIIADYFGDFKGNLLDIGANDGITFSNSYAFIKNGWTADLVEPNKEVFDILNTLYQDNKGVKCFNVAIDLDNYKGNFYNSGAHVQGGNDIGLVSTLKKGEMKRWANVDFEETFISVTSFGDFYISLGLPKYNFISIDAEGCDWDILRQIDLTVIECKCLCIEWNSDKKLGELYKSYCMVKHGMKLLHTNAENMIFVI